MNQAELEAVLQDLPLQRLRYFDRIGSTNDEAARRAAAGAQDLSLVIADEQTAGKGRAGRSWFTPPSAALAFSLVLRPPPDHVSILARYSALGALSVHDVLQKKYGLQARIKWPNDVIVHAKKVCGILAEAQWDGSALSSVVLGVGINVAPASVDEHFLPPSRLIFAAGCLETELGRPVDRLELLHQVLRSMLNWREKLATPEFLQAWENSLVFLGEWVILSAGGDLHSTPRQEGRMLGLAPDGSLRLQTADGQEVRVQAGDLRLRPKPINY